MNVQEGKDTVFRLFPSPLAHHCSKPEVSKAFQLILHSVALQHLNGKTQIYGYSFWKCWYLFIYLFMCSCTGSSVKGRLRLPTGASRLRAPVEHQPPSSPRSCVWSPSSYLSSRLSLRCPNSPISGVGSQLAPKLMLHVSCWHQELKCEGSHPPEAAHVLSVFPDRCSANSVFKRQTEKIYSQGTTIKFIFILFSAEFWFCQAQIKFTAKIHSICRREYKGYSLVFLKNCCSVSFSLIVSFYFLFKETNNKI